MCDYFLQRMEGDQAGGDLTDIVRASGSMPGSGDLPSTAVEWQLPAEPMLFPPPPSSSDGCGAGGTGADVFGDPFAGLADPFSSDYSLGADFLDAMPDAMAKVGFDTAVGGGSDCGGGGGGCGGQLLDMGRKPLLPRGMQMPAVGGLAPRLMPSPLSPRAIRPYPAMAGDMVKLGITAGQAAECTIETAVAGIQMSSPRAGGIKRRKNQERKVVCIPAPTAAGGRPSAGEVVPSDLWAWRKYGQKPIKGSPYPRGYYRCSSSKGCSARKQVERSRNDPKMLVITYTSEHNHPWPTQRNALAGSTRSHHGKNNSSSSGSKSSQNEKPQQPNVKEEPKDQATTTTTTSSTITTCTSPVVVKEESLVGSSEALERVMDTSGVVDHSELMDHVFSHFSESYKPMIPEAGQPDDFFADLAELESDPMSLIFSREYMEAKPSGGDHAQEKGMAKDLDPFDMLDWSTTPSAGSSFEQGKRG